LISDGVVIARQMRSIGASIVVLVRISAAFVGMASSS
jgi:hypothetical protein